MVFAPFLQGFGTGGGLIVAIGAQNAFVLSQGIRKNHPVIVALLCIGCDALFISLGVAGVGRAISANSVLSDWTAIGGAVFLTFYGFGALHSAVRGGSIEMDDRDRQSGSLGKTMMATLAVTLLNPHFYLDTVFLLGGISSRFPGESRWIFWAGAVLASTVWFVCLTLGGRLLAPIFRKTISWRILDSLVCLVMWSIAWSLVRPLVQ